MITLIAEPDPAFLARFRVELAGDVIGHLRQSPSHWTARDPADAVLGGYRLDLLFPTRDLALCNLLAATGALARITEVK